MDELESEVFNLKLAVQEYEDRLAQLYQTEDRSRWKGPATLLVSASLSALGGPLDAVLLFSCIPLLLPVLAVCCACCVPVAGVSGGRRAWPGRSCFIWYRRKLRFFSRLGGLFCRRGGEGLPFSVFVFSVSCLVFIFPVCGNEYL